MKVFNRSVKLGGQSKTVNGVSVRVLEYDHEGNILRVSGTTVPTGAGYAKGALFMKTDAATGVKGIYENQGTTASASFNVVGAIGDAEIVFSDAGAIDDNNGNELLEFGVTASAVNHLKATNAAASGVPSLSVVGGDTNISLRLTPKGSGSVLVGVDDSGFDVKFFGATAGKSLLWDESADTLIMTGDIQMVAGQKISSTVSNIVGLFAPNTVQQALSGAGAVNLTTFYTAVTNTGSDALTLADSTVIGQLKKIKMIVDPGTDSTLTFNTNATIVFADVGDYAVLIWNGADWIPVELGNDADGATAPAYTPAA